MLSPADHLAADELEDPGGMTWRVQHRPPVHTPESIGAAS